MHHHEGDDRRHAEEMDVARGVVAAEQRGERIKKRLEIDPIGAETVRQIYRLALHGVE